MAEPFRSLLLTLASVRRAVDREVDRRIGPTLRSAQEARDTHRRALAARDELVAGLREDNDELRQRLADLEAGNRDLRTALAERQTAERRRRSVAEERQRRERAVAQESDIRSDLFRCLNCSSLSLLTTWPDHILTLCRPVGPGCPACASRPPRRLLDVRAGLADGVVYPVREPSGPLDVSLVTGLLADDPDAASATAVARAAGDVAVPRYQRITAAERCAGLDAIAAGIDRTPAVRDGIAWCATGITGVPEFPAMVLNEIATRTDTEPLHPKAIARAIRLVGAASCAAGNHLAACPCARSLTAAPRVPSGGC